MCCAGRRKLPTGVIDENIYAAESFLCSLDEYINGVDVTNIAGGKVDLSSLANGRQLFGGDFKLVQGSPR